MVKFLSGILPFDLDQKEYYDYVDKNHTFALVKIEEILKLNNDISISKQVSLNIIYTQTYVYESIYEVLKPYNISIEQFNVLRILRGQKGKPLNMGTIQGRMLAKTSNTTRLVDKLVAKSLVVRAVCEINRRKMEVTITEKGLELLDILDKLVEKAEHSLSSKLSSEEQKQLVKLLEKIRN